MIPPQWYGGMSRWRGNAKWILYCTPRNPWSSSPTLLIAQSGACGVRCAELPDWYWRGLERAFQFLTGRGAAKLGTRVPPLQIYLVTNGDGATSPVLLLQKSKQGAVKHVMGILIELPVRNGEPLWEVELAQALTTLVHELVHALNMQVLPLARLDIPILPDRERLLKNWEWLDEGMAVAAEAAFAAGQLELRAKGDQSALPMNNDWLRWALHWVDYPELSLNDGKMVYQSSFFVRYLERRMGGPQFVHDVWAESVRVWDTPTPYDCTPLAALEKLCRKRNLVFCSRDSPDIFAAGYCFDSYFLNEPGSFGYEPDVFRRFRERAVTRTWRMENSNEWPNGPHAMHALAGLACRYFRFTPPRQSGRLEVRISPAPGQSIRNLKAELVLAYKLPSGDGHSRRDANGSVTRVTLVEQPSVTGELVGAVDNFSMACNHAALVVTNCDMGLPLGISPTVEFSVSARMT
jgi:hypothetical protein